MAFDPEELYNKLREVAESEGAFITDHADDLLGQACQAMLDVDDANVC